MIGDAGSAALDTAANEGIAVGEPVATEYWSGVPVVLVKGKLKEVALVNTLPIVPKVIVGSALAVPDTALFLVVALVDVQLILPDGVPDAATERRT